MGWVQAEGEMLGVEGEGDSSRTPVGSGCGTGQLGADCGNTDGSPSIPRGQSWVQLAPTGGKLATRSSYPPMDWLPQVVSSPSPEVYKKRAGML